jgi:hypothetical protein
MARLASPERETPSGPSPAELLWSDRSAQPEPSSCSRCSLLGFAKRGGSFHDLIRWAGWVHRGNSLNRTTAYANH